MQTTHIVRNAGNDFSVQSTQEEVEITFHFPISGDSLSFKLTNAQAHRLLVILEDHKDISKR